MRNFEERIAEIDRRSKKILAQRKKRRRMILAVCIPVVLCVSILALTRLPANNPKDVSMQSPTQESADGISIQFSGTQDEFRQFFDQLEGQALPGNGYEDANTITGATVAPEDAAEDYLVAGSIADSSTVLYSFSLSGTDGSTNEYRLTGNILVNLTTGERFLLTNDQRNQLLQLLDME